MPHAEHNDTTHAHRSLWPLIALGGIGAVIAAPYILPTIYSGSQAAAQAAIDIFHTHGVAATGSGLAGALQSGFSQIPGIGESLASGGWAAITATGVIGIGGVLLANWMAKRETATDFHWSKVIRYTALTTSILIALPSLLTGISVGLTFLVSLLPVSFSVVNGLVGGLNGTLGSAEMAASAGGTGLIAAAIPHLVSCGAAIVPLSVAYALKHERPTAQIDATTAQVKTPQKPLQPAILPL